MILLYDKNETEFTSLGLGSLKDTLSCIVVEELNGGFELEMEYPISGSNYDKIELGTIILTRPNMFDQPQPFRIYEITKPINGIVTINAEHISYDASGYILTKLEAVDLADALTKIQNGSVLPSPFTFSTDKIVTTGFKISEPISMRAVLAGQDGSLLDVYKGEYKFDKYHISLLNNRGSDRGLVIRYGKNMSDVEQEINSQKVYTGIFPYYFKHINQTETVTEGYHQPYYIVAFSKPYHYNWLSLKENSDKHTPNLVDDIPMQIKTPGEYFDQIVMFKTARPNDPIIPLVEALTVPDITTFTKEWLNIATPVEFTIYNIMDLDGEFRSKKVIWDETTQMYELYSGDGFFVIPDVIPEPFLKRTHTVQVDREDYLDLKEIEPTTNGVLFVPDFENVEPKRILKVNLSDGFTEIPTPEELKNKALDYLDKNDLREIDDSTTVSFIRLSDSEEYERFKHLERVELGDTVKIIYERLGIKKSLKVISTTYNCLTDRYDEIELGKKAASLSDKTIQEGDSISSLNNDSEFVNNKQVNDILAKTVTADFITAKNARLTEAQIQDLEVVRINVPGLIEATSATIDELVAKLLVADDAIVKNALTAGSIEVRGRIIAESGIIGGCIIDEHGNLVVTTSISIGGNFNITNEGIVTAKSINADGVYTDILNTKIIESEDVTVKKIYFGDNDVSIERITTIAETPAETESQTVTVINSSVIGMLDGYGTMLRAAIRVDKPVWTTRRFDVAVTYRAPGGYTTTTNIPVFIQENTSASTGDFYISGEVSILSSTPFPTKVVETRTITEPGQETVNNLVVTIDGEMYNIAGGGGVIQSDREVEMSDVQPQPPVNSQFNKIWYKKIDPLELNSPTNELMMTMMFEPEGTTELEVIEEESIQETELEVIEEESIQETELEVIEE